MKRTKELIKRAEGLIKRAEGFADSKDRAILVNKYTAWREGFIEGYLAAVSDGLVSTEAGCNNEASDLHLADVSKPLL